MTRLTDVEAKIMVEKYKNTFKRKGYVFFEKGDYNINIIGVRNKSGDASRFDDTIAVAYRIDGLWVVDSYKATTEPGVKILRLPIKEVRHKGTAILVPDQYVATYKIDLHGGKWKYTALCQRNGRVRVVRDNNRDAKPDYHNPEEKGWFGINIHKHRGSDARVNTGGVSAGCQVFQSSKDFAEFMDTCHESSDRYGNSFTYTLLDETDLLPGELC
jgi:hypothetical protein